MTDISNPSAFGVGAYNPQGSFPYVQYIKIAIFCQVIISAFSISSLLTGIILLRFITPYLPLSILIQSSIFIGILKWLGLWTCKWGKIFKLITLQNNTDKWAFFFMISKTVYSHFIIKVS